MSDRERLAEALKREATAMRMVDSLIRDKVALREREAVAMEAADKWHRLTAPDGPLAVLLRERTRLHGPAIGVRHDNCEICDAFDEIHECLPP